MTVPLNEKQQQQFADDYTDPASPLGEIAQKWGKKLGRSVAVGTVWNWAWQLGLKRPRKTTAKAKAQQLDDTFQVLRDLALTVPPLPVIPAPPPRVGASAKQELQLRLVLGDIHVGRQTVSYNVDVFIERLRRLEWMIRDAYHMLSAQYEITKLYIDCAGDFVLGEQVYFQMDLEDLQQVVMDQVFQTAIPWLSWFAQAMCGIFPEVEVNCVPGNHGSMGKRMSKSANWDTILYLGWKARMSQAQNITFNIAEKTWYVYSDAMGLTFLLVHGDQFPVKKGLVFNQMLDKAMRWQHSLPKPFNCLITGHFHSQQCFRISRIQCYIGGSFVSDDDWVREELGLEGSCSQLLLGVTSGGVEWARECLLE